MTQRLDLTITQGATFRPPPFTYTYPDGVTPIDLTGAAVQLEIRQNVDDPDPPLATWSTANGKIVLGALDAWSASVSYPQGALVTHAGLSWRALVANTNQTPAEGVYWTEARGLISFNVPASETLTYAWKNPAWQDLRLTLNTNVDYIWRGNALLERAVTRG